MNTNIFKELQNNSTATQDKLTLYMNYLAVMYAIFLPISWQARSTIFVFILLLFIARRNYLHYIKQSFSNPIVKAFLLYLLMHFIWLFGTDNFIHAKKMVKLAEYAIIPFVFLTFLTKDFGYKVITAFIASVLFSEMLSYLIRFEFLPIKLDLFNHTIYKAVSLHDPSPYLLHMHYAVSLSIVVAILFLKFFDKEHSFKVKLLAMFFMLSATINLTLIGGRSGYLSYVVLLITIIFIKFKKKAFFPLVGIITFISIISLSAYNYSHIFNERINYSINSAKDFSDFNTSMGTRIALWKYSIQSVKNDYIFGLGTGDQMDEMIALIPKEQEMLTNFHHVHSQYIEVLAQFGIIGLLIFLNIFYQIFKYKDLSHTKRDIMIVVSIGVMVALITETFSSIYYLPMLATLTAATIAKNEFHTDTDLDTIKKSSIAYLSIFTLTLLSIYTQ